MKPKNLAQATMVAILFSTAFAPLAHAQTVTVRPTTASPTTMTAINGTGFRAHEALDIYFDAADLALAVTNATGAFIEHSNRCARPEAAARLSRPLLTPADWVASTVEPSRFSMLNANTGAKLWQFTTGGPVYSSPAVVANGVVYVGSNDKNVYALKASTGAKGTGRRSNHGRSSSRIHT
jgi:outer membrane protein assembly factor BamB